MSAARTKFSCSREMLKLNEDLHEVYGERFGAVKALVESKSVYSLRDDSRLLFGYCSGQLPCHVSAEDIAHELMCIQYICENFGYSDVSDATLKCMSNSLRETYGISWAQTWNILVFIGCDAIKYSCMTSPLPEFQKPKRLWSDMDDE